MLAAALPLVAAGAAWGAGPGFYSHYWVQGAVTIDAEPALNRQVNFYLQDPGRKVYAPTNAQGRYLLNAYDLQYYLGIPLTFETTNYTVTPTLYQGEITPPGRPYLPAASGYLDQHFLITRSGGPPRFINGSPRGENAPLLPQITITFSKPMNIASVVQAVRIGRTTATPISTLVGWNQDRSVFYFTPQTELEIGTSYTVLINGTASDEAGQFLNAPASRPQAGSYSKFNFKTVTSRQSDNAPPTVTDTDPANGKTEVSRRPSIKIIFSEAVNADSAVAATQLPVEGKPWTVSWWPNLRYPTIATFTPFGVLAGERDYTVTIGTGLTDLTGNHMLAPYRFTFRTTQTYTGPEVINIISGTGLPVTTPIWATFSTAIEPSTLPSNFEVRDSAGNLVAGQFRWDATTNTINYIPYSRLKSLEEYTVAIKTGLTDPWGFHLGRAVTSLFVTEDAGGPVIRKVWFDGRGYVENDIISATATITAEITDPSGLDYGALSLRVGGALLISRNNFKAQDVYSNNRLAYKVYPALPQGNYIMTIEAFDVLGNSSDWAGKVRVFSGETQIVPGTTPFASPASISPLKPAAAGGASEVTMVYQLTTPGNIDLQIAGIGGVIWARRYAASTMGGYAGYNAVAWDGKDNNGSAPANGVYTFRIINNSRLLGKGYIIIYD